MTAEARVPFQPPDGMPGAKEITHRVEQASRILQTRGISIQANGVTTHLILMGLLTALTRRGLIGDDEVNYYFALARMEAVERSVVESTPGPRIVLPGQN